MSSKEKINVLIVEDSPVAQMLLVHILNSAPPLSVCGTANNGEAALEFIKHTVPDVIVMDVHMHGLDGFETTRQIMETRPVPIVICTATIDPSEVAATFRSLEAGAVALVGKPSGPGAPESEALAAKLVETVILMAGITVVRRWPRMRPMGTPGSKPPMTSKVNETSPRVVAIGTSTGGPPVLQTILAGLPRDFDAPLLIVQHIAPGFLPGLVEWLAQTTGFRVRIAVAGELAMPGCAYLAPDGSHLGFGTGGRIFLSKEPPETGLRPAVSFLFRSVAATCGSRAAGVLLTGMGKDGAAELKQLKRLGATTIAQDAASSLINGMPGTAVQLDAATHVLAPNEMPAALATWAALTASQPGPHAAGK